MNYMDLKEEVNPTVETWQASPEEGVRIRNILIDDIPEVNAEVQKMKGQPMREQVARVSAFIKSKFRNAMPADKGKLSEADYKRIEKVFDQTTPKKLSECITLGFGVCLEFHVLGKAFFDKLGIPAEFKNGGLGHGPKHTYLDILVESVWEVFDPFAEVYMEERGQENKRFHPGYYTESRTREQS